MAPATVHFGCAIGQKKPMTYDTPLHHALLMKYWQTRSYMHDGSARVVTSSISAHEMIRRHTLYTIDLATPILTPPTPVLDCVVPSVVADRWFSPFGKESGEDDSRDGCVEGKWIYHEIRDGGEGRLQPNWFNPHIEEKDFQAFRMSDGKTLQLDRSNAGKHVPNSKRVYGNWNWGDDFVQAMVVASPSTSNSTDRDESWDSISQIPNSSEALLEESMLRPGRLNLSFRQY
ncbi:hypothetical protein Tco_0734917 [Tanacetum coccineum]